MKINTKIPVLTLSGKPYKGAEDKDLTLGDVLMESLAGSKVGGKMKMYALIDLISKNDVVSVDAADIVMIKKAVEESNYNNIVAGQVLLELEAIK